MMYLETPPRLIETHVFSTIPVAFRRKGVATSWADANRPGQETDKDTDSFIEGPSFDAEGNLHVVDIPFGRTFKIAPGGEWSLVIAYEGWPNGLKIAADGRILVADYKHGLMALDAKAGRMQPLLTARNSESFRGCNDLHLAGNGDIYFTDQGQTGLHDPTGRVYRSATRSYSRRMGNWSRASNHAQVRLARMSRSAARPATVSISRSRRPARYWSRTSVLLTRANI
jgi:gluconolactonase